MFWNRRAVRIATGVVLLILGVIVALPNITGYTSLDGTVNARLIAVVAPIEGTVIDTAPATGSPLNAGEHLLTIRNDRVNRFGLSELQAELKATEDTLNSVRTQKAELVSLRNDLQTRYNTYRDAMLRNIDNEIESQKERIGANTARAEERKSDLERKEKLRVAGHLPESELVRAQVAERVAVHELEGAENELDRLMRKRDAVHKGIFIEEGRNDVPYSLQRIDEVSMNLLTLATRQDELEARLVKLKQQITDEEERLNKLSYAVLRTHTPGVMWRNFIVLGSNVIVGTQLVDILDCRNLFVDIIVHEVNYDDIYPGHEAEVRLFGRNEVVNGNVTYVRGSHADFESKVLAATLPRTEGKYAKIRVQLNYSEMNTDYQNFCQVGRTAHVRLRTSGLSIVKWLRHLWFSIS